MQSAGADVQHKPRMSVRRQIAIASVLALIAGIPGIAMWGLGNESRETATRVRFAIQTPFMPNAGALAISPDGQNVAFAAQTASRKNMLFVRHLGNVDATVLAGTEGAYAPFWSPDSQNIGFASGTDRKLKVVPVGGGTVLTVCDIADASGTSSFLGGTWGRDGVILFSTASRQYRSAKAASGWMIHRVRSTGGVPSPIVDRGGDETAHRWPQFLPDGRRFLYLVTLTDRKHAVVAGSLDSAERKHVLAVESMPTYVSTGFLLFTRQDVLYAQRFDDSTLQLKGEPVAIDDHLDFFVDRSRAAFAASAHTLVYRVVPGDDAASGRYSLVWIDRNGTLSAPFGGAFSSPSARLSPDARHLAKVERGSPTGDDIWIYDFERNQRSLLVGDPGDDHWPVWSPDGLQVAFDRVRENVPHLPYVQRADRAEPERALINPEPGFQYGVLDWTANYIVYGRNPAGVERVGAIWAKRTTGDQKPFMYTALADRETSAALSPNGRWLAYVVKERGLSEVVVQSFPDPSKGRTFISTGACPRWRKDGKELYVLGLDSAVSALSVDAEDVVFKVKKSARLFTLPPRPANIEFLAGPTCPYDVTPDGLRFISAQLTAVAPIQVVLNWTAELK
jgi:Tol biopolymer transport system component